MSLAEAARINQLESRLKQLEERIGILNRPRIPQINGSMLIIEDTIPSGVLVGQMVSDNGVSWQKNSTVGSSYIMGLVVAIDGTKAQILIHGSTTVPMLDQFGGTVFPSPVVWANGSTFGGTAGITGTLSTTIVNAGRSWNRPVAVGWFAGTYWFGGIPPQAMGESFWQETWRASSLGATGIAVPAVGLLNNKPALNDIYPDPDGTGPN